MRAAYIGFDRNCCVTQKVLSNYFNEIDYYLISDNEDIDKVSIQNIPLLVDHLLIPNEENLRTTLHKENFKFLKNDWLEFKSQISTLDHLNAQQNSLKSESIRTEIKDDKPVKVQFLNSDQIEDVVFDRKANRVCLEINKQGISSYNFLFIEDHQIVSEAMTKYTKNVFNRAPKNSHIWFCAEFEYELKKPREKKLSQSQFLFINDSLNQSILDNWFLIEVKNKKNQNILQVKQWVPYHQFKNQDFQKFIIERIEIILKDKIDLIQIKKFLNSYVCSVSGFRLNQAQLSQNKLSALLPSFNYCESSIRDNYLKQEIEKSTKYIFKSALHNHSEKEHQL